MTTNHHKSAMLPTDIRSRMLNHPSLRGPLACGSGDLKLRFAGLRSGHGWVRVAVFNNPAGFPAAPEKAFRVVSLRIAGAGAAYTLADLPFGTYAISYYHDENGNLRLDKNVLGQPTEDYGFSNGAKGLFKAPGFAEAAFTFRQPELELMFQFERVRKVL